MCVQSACKFDFQHENNLVAFEGTGFCVSKPYSSSLTGQGPGFCILNK